MQGADSGKFFFTKPSRYSCSSCTKSYDVFQAYYEAVLLTDRSPSSIAWIGSFQIVFLFPMSIMVGPLIDGGYGRLCFGGGGLMILAARGKCVVGDKVEQEGRKEGGKVSCSF